MPNLSTMQGYRIYPLGDMALIVDFGSFISPELNDCVLSLHRSLVANPFEGFVESVPAYGTLAVYYDLADLRNHFGTPKGTVSQWVEEILRARIDVSVSEIGQEDFREVFIPVCYDLSFGFDLPQVAIHTGLSIPEVVNLHISFPYRVYMIGFVPGFPYMGLLPPELEVPRKATPSISIPAGSVALAGRQTGIYPSNIPGGWQVIGRSPVRLFDIDRDPCCLLQPGMQVRFYEISLSEFENLHNI